MVSLVLMVQMLIAQPTSTSAQNMLSKASEVSYDDRSKALLPYYVRFEPNQAPTFAPTDAFINTVMDLTTSAFKLINQEKDDLGFTHYRYQQLLKGVPIEGAVFLFHVKNQQVLSLNGHCLNEQALAAIDAQSREKLTEGQALQAALNRVDAQQYAWQIPSEEQELRILMKDSSATYMPNGEKVYVFPKNDFNTEGVRLAYKFSIFAHYPMTRRWIFVDAETGKVLMEEEQIHETDAPAVANTAYSGQQNITANFTGTQYELKETTRGNGITTNQVVSQPATNTFNFAQLQSPTSTFTATTPLIYNLDVHFGTEKTYDYYKNIHNRNSIDNNGYTLTSYVNLDLPLFNPGYSNSDNAFWNGTAMFYGKGTNYNPFVCVDVTGHEITHGLTSRTANLVYQYESGALNESFSDIFGTAVEFYANSSPNWTLGEKSGLIIRDMSNPNARNHPDTYNGNFWYNGGGDNGGVHFNSGVQNFWFYLLSVGGTGTNDLGVAYTVQGIGIDKAAKIAFRNLTVYMTNNSNYTNARVGAISAATDLYGAGSNEVTQVTNAWCAVGVGGTCVPNTMPTIAITNPLNNAILAAPATFSLAATAADADGTIRKVDFFIGTSLMASLTTAPYSLNIQSLGVGTYTFNAKAYDNLNGITSAAPVTITVSVLPCVATAPATPSVSAITAATATVSWAAVAGAVSYRVDYKQDATTTWTSVNTTATSVNLGSLSPATLHNVRIYSLCDATILSAASTTASFTTSGSSVRPFPVGLPTCLEDDFRELEKLYDATNGATWTDKSNWFSANMATWKGVTLSSNGCDVLNINLPNNNLIGNLPNLNLPNLQYLTLFDNKLSGTIPNFNLPSLLTLILYGNQLSGTIPNFALPNLQTLYLSRNQLSGTIPNFNLPNLTWILLSNNNLTGTIPTVNLPLLQRLSLSTNQLTGTIPNFNLPNLYELALGNNQLTGPIPNFNLPSLRELYLYSNQLTGAIPNFNFPNLKDLWLNQNQLSGCLPSGLRSLCSHVTTGNISSNPNLSTQDWAAFCANGTGECTTTTCTAPATPSVSSITNTSAVINWGVVGGSMNYSLDYKTAAATTWTRWTTTSSVNATLTGLQQATTYNVRAIANCVAGASTPSVSATFTTLGRAFPVGLPTCLEDDFRELEKLYDVAGGDNWTDKTGWFTANMATWKGIILTPNGCDVLNINLPNNNLIGNLPNLNLPNLQYLTLNDNKLNGTIPNFNLPNLNQLSLGSNQLTGAIPNFTLPNLKQLILLFNKLTGTVPNFNFPNLQYFNLGGNQLTGTIPNFNFPNLQSLVLGVNKLSGTIPIFNFPNLVLLDLGGNQLTGTIPIFNFPNLTDLYLSQNQLTGTIPNFNFLNLRYLSLVDNQLTGSIPNFNLPSLLQFRLDKNQLSGCLPSGLRNLCSHVTSGNITNNPNLATQDWNAFCANGTGECVTGLNTAYKLAQMTLKCNDTILNIALVLGQAITNIDEGYTVKLTYDVNQLTFVDAFKGTIVPADASLLKTLAAGGDVLGIALSQNNISGSIGDTLLKLQFRIKPAAAVANTNLVVAARVTEAKMGVEQIFNASTTYTVAGTSAAKIMVYNGGTVPLNDGVPTYVKWTGPNPMQSGILSGGQVTLQNNGNTTLSITRQAAIPVAAPVIGGQDAFKAWNILSNYTGYIPTVDEIIAADANGNGTITIADITAILKRGIGLLPSGFPQASGGYKDWRFYPKSLLTTPSFIISSKYPICDGSGYCSTNVPIIADSYPLQITSTNCDVITKEWNSVLIGNVTGSTGTFFRNPSVQASLRSVQTVKFMLTDSVRTAAGLFIPIFIADMIPTTGLDIAFSSPSVIVEGLTDTLMNYSMNSVSNRVSISAFAVSNEGVISGVKIGYLKIRTVVNRPLNAADFGTVVANVNGEIINANIEFTAVVIPVKLIKFEGHPLSKNVELTWSTASELQNDHFEMQRSVDGKTFSKIGHIKGQGTTAVPHNYQLLDESPFMGINYYRLKQVDLNGQFEFSKTISVDMLNAGKTISVYPNPVKDNVTIETNITSDYTIELFDIAGKLLQRHPAHTPVLQLSTGDLLNGVYIISVTSQAIHKTFKIVKQ